MGVSSFVIRNRYEDFRIHGLHSIFFFDKICSKKMSVFRSFLRFIKVRKKAEVYPNRLSGIWTAELSIRFRLVIFCISPTKQSAVNFGGGRHVKKDAFIKVDAYSPVHFCFYFSDAFRL